MKKEDFFKYWDVIKFPVIFLSILNVAFVIFSTLSIYSLDNYLIFSLTSIALILAEVAFAIFIGKNYNRKDLKGILFSAGSAGLIVGLLSFFASAIFLYFFTEVFITHALSLPVSQGITGDFIISQKPLLLFGLFTSVLKTAVRFFFWGWVGSLIFNKKKK